MEMNWEEGIENGGGDEGAANAIELIEEYLMKEDDDGIELDGVGVDDLLWLDDILLDFPTDPSSSPPLTSEPEPEAEAEGNVVNSKTNISDVDTPNFENDKSSGDDHDQVLDTDDDPLSKKRKRQLRNRDAAMRSRERKKIYVKDLEAKSRYLEAECRRLGRLLQCCYAENQMLRISLGSAYGASMTKPESAVLLLESLLLVSLVWLMVNMFLPKLPLLNQDAVPHASVVERKEQESTAPNGKGTKVTDLWVTLSFVKSKRCTSSRVKMKFNFDFAALCF